MTKSTLIFSMVPVESEQQKIHASHKIVEARHGSHELVHCQVTPRSVKVSRVEKNKRG